MAMTNQPLTTRPPDTYEEKIKEKYAESFANQSDLMDKLAQQLLTLELAIPGLYATVLKLISGDKATVPVNNMLYVTFGLWVVALGLTLMALMPREWKVNPEIMLQDPESTTGELGIKDFFAQSARYKRNLLMVATLLFFLGIAFAALTVS
jgi:hypothetical protein